jgi:centromere protein C
LSSPGNSYSIMATSNRDVKLFFTQGRRILETPTGETYPDEQQPVEEEPEEEEDEEEEEEEEGAGEEADPTEEYA